MGERVQPLAVVMNMSYTGLGIARSLGERGVSVIGLSAQPRLWGNFTRYAKVLRCPDSRHEPEALLHFLLTLGPELVRGSVLFPTRDDDVLFLDRYRDKLAPYFVPVVPEHTAVERCLDKWKTYKCAVQAEVPAPKCWVASNVNELLEIAEEITWPCVLKPVAAYHWRKGANWDLVGCRKAIAVQSRAQLAIEYARIAPADERVLLQEMIAGPDDQLLIAACYLDRRSTWVGGFNAQKILQIPEGFGTGCIVRLVNRPELFEPTERLLKAVGFRGIAEVEYKWDAAVGQFKLIEINPRPWDQHRLGRACGVDLIYLAYCEHAGLPIPVFERKVVETTWVADDVLISSAVQSVWRRDGRLWPLLRSARGKRIYGIWSARDPLPFFAYLAMALLPALVATLARRIWGLIRRTRAHTFPTEESPV